MKVHDSRVFLGFSVAVFSVVSFWFLRGEVNADIVADQEHKVLEPKSFEQAKLMAIKTYGRIIEASYTGSLLRAIELRKQVKTLVAEPTQDHHDSAKKSWVQARLPYLQTEALYSHAGNAVAINSWPINPGYIDYVEGHPESGIICNPEQFPDLSPESLEKLNGRDGITTGYHVIEFLLWGEASGLASRGKRTHIDYAAGRTKNAERRGAFLVSCCDHLIRQLAEQLAEWKVGVADNARERYEKLPVNEAIKNIFTGIGQFVEAHPEARNPGEVNKGRNLPASFSGLSHIDLVHNAAGIAHVVTGAYVGVDGKVKVRGVGLIGLAEQVSPVRSERLRHYMNASMRSVQSMNASLSREILQGGDAPAIQHSRIFTNALGYLLKEVDKLAVDLEYESAVDPEP
ncbi:MAG: hypothetical protein GY899_12190 [Verrucomicrobiaceae bacterium]|nr:hypothetical protein [Verrucomicrobiaceae bacterium]